MEKRTGSEQCRVVSGERSQENRMPRFAHLQLKDAWVVEKYSGSGLSPL